MCSGGQRTQGESLAPNPAAAGRGCGCRASALQEDGFVEAEVDDGDMQAVRLGLELHVAALKGDGVGAGAQGNNDFNIVQGDAGADLVAEIAGEVEQLQEQIKIVRGFTECTFCGSDIPNGAKFCNSCGNKVEAPVYNQVSMKICPNCGAQIAEDCLFCTSCGYRMVQPEAPAQPEQDPNAHDPNNMM